jgi:predicted transcriptional regulator
MEKKEKAFTIRIAVDLLEEMRVIARQHDRSLNGEILTALRDYVARHKRLATGKG